MIEASDGVIEMASRVGVAEQRMQNALDSLDAEESALTLAYNDRLARDPFEAAARLQTLETATSSCVRSVISYFRIVAG